METRKINTVREVVNVESGEVYSSDKQIVLTKEPNFVKLYLDEISRIYELPKNDGGILLLLAKHITYENEIYLNSYLMKKMAEDLNIKIQSFRNSLVRLTKSNLLKRIATGVYVMNPKIIAKGPWVDIEKLRLKVSFLFSEKGGRIIESIETEVHDSK